MKPQGLTSPGTDFHILQKIHGNHGIYISPFPASHQPLRWLICAIAHTDRNSFYFEALTMGVYETSNCAHRPKFVQFEILTMCSYKASEGWKKEGNQEKQRVEVLFSKRGRCVGFLRRCQGIASWPLIAGIFMSADTASVFVYHFRTQVRKVRLAPLKSIFQGKLLEVMF